MTANKSRSASARTPLLTHASTQPDGSVHYSSPTETESQDDGNAEPSTHEVPAPIRTRLYMSHALSTWNSRVFEIGAVLYLASIYPGTLLPVSIYSLARGASAAILSPVIGQYIDTCNRLRVVRLSIVLQRLAIAASCLLFWSLVRELRWAMALKTGALAVLAVLACIEKLCSVTICVAIEKDWVIVIADQDEGALRKMNPQMRRIDLISKLASPFFISTLDTFSTELAILANLAMNLSSIALECHAITSVYHRVPSLSEPKQSASRHQRHHHPRSPLARLSQTLRTVHQEFHAYLLHPAFLPSFSSALLNLSALAFSGQIITYLLSLGFTPLQIGGAQAAAAAFELSATWIAPRVTARVGVIRTAGWAMSWQMVWLGVGGFVFWVFEDAPVAAAAAAGLVGGAVVSRVGFWGFNMSTQVIVQEEVEEERRGAFSSVEASWQNAFELCSYGTTVVFSRPDQFRWPVLISCVAVFVAGGLYAVFLQLRRGHVFDFDCVEPRAAKVGAGCEGLVL